MNEYCSFDFETKKWFLSYLFLECKKKCKFSNNSINVLYCGVLHRVNFRPVWTCSVKNRMFSNLPKTNLNFSVTFILSSANSLNLDQSKILSFGKKNKEIRNRLRCCICNFLPNDKI